MMESVTGEKPRISGPSIVGFGTNHYRHVSGREGDFFIVGFAPRKQNLTLYMGGGHERHKDLMAKPGECSTGKSRLCIKRLADQAPGVIGQH
jgi:hypothetical protein